MDNLKFLMSNYKELIYNKNFFPNKNMTKNQILISFTKYSIIIIILFYFIGSNSNWYYLPIGIIIGSLILYLLDINKQKEDKQKILDFVECKKPNINNPYMNVLVTQNDENLPACDSRDKEVSKLTKKFYKFNLYQNGDDLFDKKNMERQFYTMPSTTIPNKQDDFMKSLYNNYINCKTNSELCLPYEDNGYH